MELLLTSIILFLAIIATRISDKSGIPSLILFILLGMGFGILGVEFSNFTIADYFANLALMVIMFQGGYSTNWNMVKPVAKVSILLSFLGVVVTALVTGLFCHYVLGLNFLESMLLGSVVGSTDYSSVSSILKSRKLNLKYNTGSILEIESGSNDPAAYTMTMIFLSLILGSQVFIPLMIFKQIVFGVALGFLFGKITLKLIDTFKFDGDGIFTLFIVASMLLTYSFSNYIGGNGFLSVYLFGILIGNRQYIGKRDAIFFFDGLSSIMQVGLFFILGLISNPSHALKLLPLSFIIMAFMTLVARPISIFGLLKPFKMPRNQKLFLCLSGLRGAAAVAFAIMVVNSGANISEDIYHIVFGIAVISTLLQGWILPTAALKLNMVDKSDTMLRTFNEYQDKSNLGFIETTITENSRWVGEKVSNLNMAFDIIVAKIQRNNEIIVPRGNTTIKAGDKIVLGGKSYFDTTGYDLVEFTVTEDHKWAGRILSDLELPDELLIIMLLRDDEILVPTGKTKILPNDTLVTIRGTLKD